jgi:hypothetical protein
LSMKWKASICRTSSARFQDSPVLIWETGDR